MRSLVAVAIQYAYPCPILTISKYILVGSAFLQSSLRFRISSSSPWVFSLPTRRLTTPTDGEDVVVVAAVSLERVLVVVVVVDDDSLL